MCLLLPLALVGCSDRVAEVPLDIEQIKLDACEGLCAVYDECDVDLSWTYEYWPEPQGCVDRCMALLPLLHEENQCGSWQIISLRCRGALDCEGYAAYEAGAVPESPDWSAPCVVETLELAGCSTDKPFDLDETIPVPDWP